MLKTIQKYAIETGTSPQNVRNKKKLPLVKCKIFALHNGQYFEVGEQLFVHIEK